MTSVGVVLIRRSATGNEVLLEQLQNAHGARRWDLLFGKIKRGETVEQAAVREVRDRIGVTISVDPSWLSKVQQKQNGQAHLFHLRRAILEKGEHLKPLSSPTKVVREFCDPTKVPRHELTELARSVLTDGALSDGLDDVLVAKSGASLLGESYTYWSVRDDATPHMLADLATYGWGHVVFLGVSNQNLVRFFKRILHDHPQDKVFRWEEVEVFYAREDVGVQFERVDYLENLRRSRQEIARFFTDKEIAKKFPKLRRLELYLDGGDGMPRHHGGCLMATANKNGPVAGFEVIYRVDQSPQNSIYTEHLRTERLRWQGGHGAQDRRFLDFVSDYAALKASARSLGRFGPPTLWDASAAKWSTVEEKGIQKNSMLHLLGIANLQAHQRVLDVGCGAGPVSQEILKGKVRDLTILDCSPQMLASARSKVYTRHSYARMALATVPTAGSSGEDIDLWRDSFDVILMHFSIQSMCPNRAPVELSQLVEWSQRYLRPKGQVWIAAHNTFVDLKTKYDPAKDPLRLEITRQAQQKGWILKERPESGKRLRPYEVERAFKVAGFELVTDPQVQRVHVTCDHRICMWQCPAILAKELVDLDATTPTPCQEEIDTLIGDAAKAMRGINPTPRDVIHWGFELP